MKISVFLPPWGETATPENFDLFAEVVDDGTFHAMWIGDHVAVPLSVDSTYHYNSERRSPFDPQLPLFEPLTLAAYLAARTSHVRIGMSVFILAMRSPVEAAKALGCIDALAGGRLVVGIGAGWMAEEFALLDADYATRGPRTDEGIAILRHLWNGNEDGFIGAHHTLAPVQLTPLPSQPIPIVIGGNTAAAMKRAVTLGDGWHALRIDPERLGTEIVGLRQRLDARGRDPQSFTIITRDTLVETTANAQGPSDTIGDPVWDAARRRLDAFAKAGVDEFIVEFPGLPMKQQTEWFQWLSSRLTRETTIQRA